MSDVDKDIEILVLRHQLAVIGRQVNKVRYEPADRALLGLLARFLPRPRWRSFLVTPNTVLRWQRDLVRRRWTYPQTRMGRPPLDPEVVELVLRLGRENRRWGYLRIRGELAKLGVSVSATTIRNLLHRHGLRPRGRGQGPSWSDFLRAQAASVIACDFFTVETVTLKRLYALFFIELSTRRVWLAGVTSHPSGPWVTQQARNLTMTANFSPLFLIRDRDAKFSGPFDEIFRSEGVRIIRTPIRAPKANAYAERWVGTVRRECLDWLLIFGRRHLERVLRVYVAHYNHSRPHRGLRLATPVAPRSPEFDRSGPVRRRDLLGGLIHEYEQAA